MVVADHRTREFHCRNLIRLDTMLPRIWPSCCRRLRSMALLADVKCSGTPIDGLDGLLAQMTKAVLERDVDVCRFQEIRKTIDTNAIESLNYQLRKVTKARGPFPSDAAGLKLL